MFKQSGAAQMAFDEHSRRFILKGAALSALAASTLAISETTAEAYQGNMERALWALRNALADLRHATSDKGGHKAAAVQLIEQAIGEVQAGIAFAAQHFGD
jgi:hypothetical protein